MKYFAYGSNMCINRLRRRVPSCQFYAVASLKGYVLRFHKKSIDGSGKCNALQTADYQDIVIGVVFEIAETDKPTLDDAEGIGNGYHEKTEKLYSSDQEIIAYMYVADDDAIDDKLTPYTWYKDFVVQGARQHQLQDSYIQKLEAFSAFVDPDKTREEQNRRILPC